MKEGEGREIISVLGNPRKGRAADDLGVKGVAGPEKALLVAQAERGFAHVPEGSLEVLLRSKGKAVPEADADGVHRKTDLVPACIAAVKPEATDTEASECVSRGFLLENPDCYSELHVAPEMLAEVLVAGEAQKVAEYAAQVAEQHAKKDYSVSTREARMVRYFKPSDAPKYTALQKRGPRWLPEKDKQNTAAITKWIEKFSPPGVDVQCDDYNGRWRVICGGLHKWKSISWTKRGYERAACESIHQAWVYAKEFSGAAPPFSLEDLAARWKDAAAAA